MKRKILILMSALILGTLPLAPAYADENLDQVVEQNEQIAPAGTKKIFSEGHADLGIVVSGERAEILIRDDSADKPVWRHPEDVTFNLQKSAIQVLPEGTDYNFTGATAGDGVWVIPQQQIAHVPWLGWNTQHPGLANMGLRGVTIEYAGHIGPGEATVFEQDGGFAKPRVLWTSKKKQAQPVFTEIGTHAHANWVFTKPGVHLIAIRMRMEGRKQKSLHTYLRFAVQTDPHSSVDVSWQGKMAEVATRPEKADAARPERRNGYLFLGIGAGVFVAAGVAYLMTVRSKRAREEAEAQ
ncbi:MULTISPECIES: choice-of-anchor M domain-containing protein [Winkia]|uniref:choice-of-anchor M domain-containing protein n=1 Tax=Winkia TaxID=2692118 RepID=UPI0015DFB1CF|nr:MULTISPECIES: choice-of-anchor M domain-containing protein [Winkia]MDK7162413.1 choice-of-anchor M domain-containing protein [Winkia sp. UMB3105]MDK8594352.1 choice-of-anchor M domain-containing protein [Winkia sp. UMB1096A]MDU2269013.1 choice-of-anchor M domain-containing protein [Winkia neuii]WEB56200.1 choice-of-anchor M domain-containing protein [Winkia neuii]